MTKKRVISNNELQLMTKDIVQQIKNWMTDNFPIEMLLHQKMTIRLWEGHPKNPFAKETNYTGYKPVTAEPGDWIHRENKVKNRTAFEFPQSTDPREHVITYWAITDEAGMVIFWGMLKDPLWVTDIIKPVFEKKSITIIRD